MWLFCKFHLFTHDALAWQIQTSARKERTTVSKPARIILEGSSVLVIKNFKEMAHEMALVVQVTPFAMPLNIPISPTRRAALTFACIISRTLCAISLITAPTFGVVVICVHNRAFRPIMLTDLDECATQTECKGGTCVNIVANKTSDRGYLCNCFAGYATFLQQYCIGESLDDIA